MESREIAEAPKDRPRTTRFRPIHAVLLVPVLAVVGLWVWPYLATVGQRVEYAGRETTFSDDSDKLKQTVIVPTLDSPMPTGRNVIWCSSFQLAWNEVRDKVIGAPLEVLGAEEIAARLNAAQQSASDLDEKSVYAAGGWVEKGIREKIKKDMAAKFPSHELPDFSPYNSGILSYSYLTARVPFKYPFCQVDEGFTFTDSQGGYTRVDGFGLWEAYRWPYRKIAEQVKILYLAADDRDRYFERPKEYALDLCRYSKPYQVVVARVEPKGSLGEILEYVQTTDVGFQGAASLRECQTASGG